MAIWAYRLQKLERNGPELLFEMKSGMKINSDNYKKKIRNKEMELPKKNLPLLFFLCLWESFSWCTKV